MSQLEWSDEFKLGLPAIDADHRDLLELCNEFLAAAQTGSAISQLAAILDRLVLRTRAHFVAEERLLDRHGYPGLAMHKAEHDRLLAQADNLKVRFSDPAEGQDTHRLTGEAADFLRFWLFDHIRTNDRPYQPFIRRLV
ncbi:bacteriohemerythrin [Magnetospirillum sp. UT-4]|uniref:bacteriohemerythrin n=1 Tax=Magnetospirillum sp. UT-4 TaxID=2681467 RepID=UPI00137D1A06|nr:bacteriohemerythrin [Magnetospirillum sp. UT-4]CAA7618069.1 putative bacteriohemerythrin [Magnetospirillum sp. UT-4]